jgi:hypothetical protein
VLAALVLSSCGRGASAVVTSLTPTSGPARGGTPVTIDGSDLSGVTAVSFGGTPAHFTVVSSTELTAVAPGGSGDVVVSLTNGASHL